ncbi:hypothetical protein M446_5797 [Methylobacterium sp. 4-46]|uniref:hypothetical protein n=1 Tax=unclassified Methylobacterium TaxID=2615210 RepID=UPI000165CD2C|nr:MULTISPECIES: hypothetical protein [Methylobacterium]ACA20084.1 hypothetical protein M446_5797 [Methylobacterium sp. 4-46]WFT79270.1 hypothetical protein QA634_29255 [Methylobacterium nodulans]
MTMAGLIRILCLGAAGLLPLSAQAGPRRLPPDIDATGTVGGRAPWSQPWEYDSGSDNDHHPERPYYQQGRGQQTGGPARNLLPDDGLHIVPR